MLVLSRTNICCPLPKAIAIRSPRLILELLINPANTSSLSALSSESLSVTSYFHVHAGGATPAPGPGV